MPERRNAYTILGVSRTASVDAIERAYRQLARKYHPDLNPSPDATVRMQDINWARDTLTDPYSRYLHDMQRQHYGEEVQSTPSSGAATRSRPRSAPSHAPYATSQGTQSRTSRPSARWFSWPRSETHERDFLFFIIVTLIGVPIYMALNTTPETASLSMPGFNPGADYSATFEAAKTPVTSWNKINSQAEREHYQQIMDELSNGIGVQVGGYIGRRDLVDTARYYCPPVSGYDGPPVFLWGCTLFDSPASDMGTFSD